MYCERCDSIMEEGSLVCMTCGTERRDEPAAPREAVPSSAEPPETPLEDERPRCAVHETMPVLGTCPRYGKAVCVRCAPGAVDDVLTCGDCERLTAAHQKVPADARCAVHSDVAAVFTCARCGSFACNACNPLSSATPGYCARCADTAVRIPASRGDRLGAALIDNLVIILPAIAAVVGSAFAFPSEAKRGPAGSIMLMAGVGFLIGIAGELWAQVGWGQSIGKRLMGIKVLRTNGQPIELWRLVLLRNVSVQVLSQATGFFGLIDVLFIFTASQRCLHDYLADSMVVTVDKTSPDPGSGRDSNPAPPREEQQA